MVPEYRSCAPAGSKPVSAAGNTWRITLSGSAANAGNASISAQANTDIMQAWRSLGRIIPIPISLSCSPSMLFYVDIGKLAVKDRVLLEAEHPRSDQLVAQPRNVEAPRRIYLHLPRHQKK